jgi:cobalt-zinc-cadmium efflux system membrane fusion protein
VNATHMRRSLLCAVLVSACGRPHSHDDATEAEAADHAGAEAIAVTTWTKETELFVEFPPLVAGQDSPFAAHLTMLDGFSAVATGRVQVVLSGGGVPEERFVAEPSATPGIFRPVVTPAHAAQRDVTLILETPAGTWSHAVGTHPVFASASEVPAATEEDAGGEIAFLKEQQWKMAFSTHVVAEAPLRRSISAFARVQARADGEVTVTAPATGRLIASSEPLPLVGTKVESGDLLARFVPRLEGGADVASLDLAVASARLDLEQATRERERLEGLFADGAVPERRVVEARHEEAMVRAALDAASRRTGQFRRVQRTGGRGKGSSIEIRTPLSGSVLEVHGVAGALVEDGAPLFRVVDASSLWLSARVPEVDAPQIAEVGGAWFVPPGSDEAVEVGADAIVTRGGIVDDDTRTVTVVFAVPNPEGELRVGSRVEARLVVGEPVTGPAVPTHAVLFDAGLPIVFVQTGGESFERRQVRTGVRDRDLVEIVDGLALGERVVVEGAYAVKLASASTSPPAHGHAH